jgi:hypothetical protein
MADMVLDPGLILAMVAQDVQANDLTPRMQPGQFTLLIDRIGGPRICRYMHNQLASALDAVAGGLYTRAAITAIASASAGGTTTSIVTSGLTASAHVGKLAYVKTATVAGAAPEGEVGLITANSATVVTVDSRRPFSSAIIATTAVDIYPQWEFIKAAAGDLAWNVLGVCLATGGITNGNWGVLQSHGLCPDAKCLSSAVLTINKGVIAGTEQFTVSSTSAVSLLLGFAPVTVNSTNSGKAPVFVQVFSPTLVSA